MTEAKRTPLYKTHMKYGGKIVEFGGWLLPVQYSGILEEHSAVRNAAGLFDVSHMGEITVQGPDALKYLQELVTNDVSRMAKNQVQYTPMCYLNGGTVDDLLIYKHDEDNYLLIVNAANTEKDFNWTKDNQSRFNVRLDNISDQVAQLALQGPGSEAIMSKLTNEPLQNLRYYWFMPEVQLAGKKVMLSRTGYTGEDGFEIYCRPEDVEYLWEGIIEAGKPLGLLPAGLGCRDTLRFEACFPLYGRELSADISPLEAGLDRFVKVPGKKFIGSDALLAQKTCKIKRKLAGFAMVSRGIARAGYRVFALGRQIGVVTTGSYAPSLNKNLGLALVETEFEHHGEKIAVEIRDHHVEAEIIRRPFYKRKGK